MAYSDPGSQTTGDLITAAIWNQNVVSNIDYLYAALHDVIEFDDYQEVVNTTDETTILSYTVTGGTLGTDKSIRLMFGLSFYNNTGGAETITVKVKLGSTTLHTGIYNSITNSSTARSIALWDVVIANEDSASAQRSIARAASAMGLAAASLSTATVQIGWQTATESTASDLALTVTVDPNTASASLSARLIGAVVIKPVAAS
jgi:hypothetical protein